MICNDLFMFCSCERAAAPPHTDPPLQFDEKPSGHDKSPSDGFCQPSRKRRDKSCVQPPFPRLRFRQGLVVANAAALMVMLCAEKRAHHANTLQQPSNASNTFTLSQRISKTKPLQLGLISRKLNTRYRRRTCFIHPEILF